MRSQWIELWSDDEGSTRPPSTDSEPSVTRPVSRREVVVAIDNRDVFINIHREQIQTFNLELTKIHESIQRLRRATKRQNIPDCLWKDIKLQRPLTGTSDACIPPRLNAAEAQEYTEIWLHDRSLTMATILARAPS